MVSSFPRSLALALLLIFSWNEISDARISARHSKIDIIQHRTGGIIKKSLHQTRQQNCESILDNYPTGCNATLISFNITGVPPQSDLTALNILYRHVCVPRCIDPFLRYYQCLDLPDNIYNYIETLIKQGVCGTYNGDFCEVVYLRNYALNLRYLEQLEEVCPFPLSAANCASANSTCRTYVAGFISNMGCCTIPYIGDVRSCYNNVDEPCQYVSSYDITSPAFWCLLFAVLAVLIY